MTLQEKINWHYRHSLKHHFPYLWCKKLYKESIGRPLKLSNPRDINQKILWLSFFTDTTLWTILADKYAVRKYVVEHADEDILVPLLGKWNKVEDIDFDRLPDKFVIKPNNGCYDTIIVKDKKKANFDEIRQRLNLSLKKRFGFEKAEPHYLRIKPCIIAEQLLETNEEGEEELVLFEKRSTDIFVQELGELLDEEVLSIIPLALLDVVSMAECSAINLLEE